MARATKRPERADAIENRARVLDAARRVFAEHGASGSTDAIASEAGVGVATVFRHFPSKEELLGALMVEQVEQLAAEVETLVARQDAKGGFFVAFEKLVAQTRTKLAVADALAERGVNLKAVITPAKRRLGNALGLLLAQAQEAGAVRGDVTTADVVALAVGTARASESAGWDPQIARRALAVVFDGLRAPASSSRRDGPAALAGAKGASGGRKR
jgi:AcrR family transcriptional regulator